ncbi:lactase/phlorizin hydrolase-like isoform X2 [Frankliniella occidentalis]|uniref:Lactase/phlorizin hydrolase-like isoform X2 n=1 Tax=Frankliniella occidentalis TaxID=133901 RepID=A0A9C6X596_FRAOC|nr:lactase/phlorizin hydrolase-like isoform X2 [Frankliniella occidentalis]
MGVHDNQRAAYHSAFLRTLVSTVKQYSVSVLAYSAWSLIDSFEFSGGYSRPFGLIHVDYASGSLDRSHKDSSSFWIKLRETNSVPFVEPDQTTTLSPPTSTQAPSTATSTQAPSTATSTQAPSTATSTQAPSTAAPSSCTRASSSMTVLLLAVLGLMLALSRSSK